LETFVGFVLLEAEMSLKRGPVGMVIFKHLESCLKGGVSVLAEEVYCQLTNCHLHQFIGHHNRQYALSWQISSKYDSSGTNVVRKYTFCHDEC